MNILIGITGSIAAYKICDLIRKFVKVGHNVKVVLTPSALEFVTATTLETLSNNFVYASQFNKKTPNVEHIELCGWADVFLVAPIGANTVSKIANGICDNLLTSLACAFKKQLFLAPAMNTGMWNNPIIKENMEKLKNVGMNVIEPASGFLACGAKGEGRLAKVDDIFDVIQNYFSHSQLLKGKKILITAGGTQEAIDPVRYITNRSSGKMGLALAESAKDMGAEVTLVNAGEFSALGLFERVKKEFEASDILIMAAAVADYRPIHAEKEKIKKSQEKISLELVKNPDIVSEMAKIKRNNQTIIAFSAETSNVIENSIKKLKTKGVDFIVANDVSKKGIGFDSDYNEVCIIDKSGNLTKSARLTKKEIAKFILGRTFEETLETA